MPTHLGEFEQLVLFALLRLGERAYGMAIRREIEDRTGREVAQGAVYMTLNRLEDRGFVASIVADSTPARGGRRRKYYTLEPDGARTLQRLYGEVQAMADGTLDLLAEVADHRASGGAA